MENGEWKMCNTTKRRGNPCGYPLSSNKAQWKMENEQPKIVGVTLAVTRINYKEDKLCII